MGKKFIEPFKETIQIFVRDGNDDEGKKLSASRIQETLILRKPMRYGIPSVHQVTFSVQSVLRKMKKNVEIHSTAPQRPTKRGVIGS